MINNELDKRFFEQLAAKEQPIDTDALWKEIEPKIRKKKKIKGFLFWWCILIPLGLLVGGIALFYPKTKTNAAPAAVSEYENGVSEKNTATNPTTRGAAAIEVPQHEVGAVSLLQSAQAAEVANVIISASKTSAPIDLNPPSSFEKKTAKVNSKAVATFFATDTLKAEPVSGGVRTAGAASEQPLTRAATLPSFKNQSSRIAILALLLPQFIPSPRVDRPLYSSDKTPLVLNKAPNWVYLIRPEVGCGFMSRTLKTDVDSLQSLLSERKKTEKLLDFMQVGLLGGSIHTSGFYVLTGLTYTRLNEQFEVKQNQLTVFDTMSGIVEMQISSLSDTTFLTGMIVNKTTTSLHKRVYNTLSFVDIPLLVGYEWKRAQWSVAIELGAAYNISFNKEGQLAGANNTIENLRNTKYLVKTAPVQYNGALRLGYQLNKKLQLGMAPHVRHLPNIAAGTGFNQRYNLYGVNFSCGYKL